MQKVPGVATVEVRLNQGLTVLDLKPGNTVTLSNLRQVIRNSGFTTPEARVTAQGAVRMADGRLLFEVSGSRERFWLTADDAHQSLIDELRRRAAAGTAASVEIDGTTQPAAKGEWPMQVTALRTP